MAKARDIFTPGRTPTVTFVDQHLRARAETFRDAIDQRSLLIAISGPSKSGKTAFVENLVGKQNLLSISGAGIQKSNDLWMRILPLLGLASQETESSETSRQTTTGAGAELSGNAIIAAGKASTSISNSNGTKSTTARTIVADPYYRVVERMAGSDLVLFIDDFHYIPKEVQIDVAKQIKDAVSKEVLIVCASVPYHSDDVLRANADLRGRVVSLDFDYWDNETLRQIATKGFEAMEIRCEPHFLNLLTAEAAGSPQLMQQICLQLCFAADVRETPPTPFEVPNTNDFLKSVCTRVAYTTDYSSTTDKMKEGPKTRGTERNIFDLKKGGKGDVYSVVLRAIALPPPQLTFRYTDLQQRIKDVCRNGVPTGSSVTEACRQIASIANAAEAKPILEWDNDSEVLDIQDPYLLFFLRWSDSLN